MAVHQDQLGAQMKKGVRAEYFSPNPKQYVPGAVPRRGTAAMSDTLNAKVSHNRDAAMQLET